MAQLDLSNARLRAAIRRASFDPLGQGVYEYAGQVVRATQSATAENLVALALDGWYADRARVDLCAVESSAGTDLSVMLVAGTSCKADTFAVLFAGTVTIKPGSIGAELCLGEGAGWLYSWLGLLATVKAPGDSVSFAPRFVMDRVGTLFTAKGPGVV